MKPDAPINDGGPAFPFAYQGPTTGPEFYYGMSLRDYFAAAALMGLMVSGIPAKSRVSPDLFEEVVAQSSYKLADAMLLARQLQPQPKDTHEPA